VCCQGVQAGAAACKPACLRRCRPASSVALSPLSLSRAPAHARGPHAQAVEQVAFADRIILNKVSAGAGYGHRPNAAISGAPLLLGQGTRPRRADPYINIT
jgi:hypothetical protein